MIRHNLKYDCIELFLDGTWENKTLKDFFDHYCISRKNRYLLTTNKGLLLNKQRVLDETTLLHKKDCITIKIPNEEPGFKLAEKPCKVVYEDDFVYVAHKDAGIIIHGDVDDTTALANMAATYQALNNIHTPVRYIHRLDKDTSGLVLFVKIPFFQPFYDQLLKEKKIRRHYYAISIGKASVHQSFTYKQPIAKDRHVSGKFRVASTGKDACTKVTCVKRKNQFELMSCELETGRTHQIRVHLSNNHHPIVNDPLYGIAALEFEGMGLWANELSFIDPCSDTMHTVTDFPNPAFDYFK